MVRSVCVDSTVCWVELFINTANVAQSGVIFTAGEDGFVRAYVQPQAMLSPGTSKGNKTKKSGDVRYKPY